MNLRNANVRRFFEIFGALALIGLSSCSGRVVVRDSLQSDLDLQTKKKKFPNSNADVVVQTDAEASKEIALISPLPSEVMTSSFISAVDSLKASEFRFSLVEGEQTKCDTWSEFQPLSVPLKLDLGTDGAKTLCLQGKESNGNLTAVVVMPFHKKSVPEDGPTYVLQGKPAAYTSQSSAKIYLDSSDGVQYRYTFVSGTTCKTLEAETWQSINKPIENLNFKHDGVWSLCIDIRDKYGNKNKIPHKHSWTRDTVYPVVDEISLPSELNQAKELVLNISGNFVYEYQFAVIKSVSSCLDANYSSFRLASVPLVLQIKGDEKQTLCIMSRSETDLVQQEPYSKILSN